MSMARIGRIKIWARYLCWHFWRRNAWIRGRRCMRCWLRHEMWIEFNKEVDKQLLYGEGA